ncbi:transcription termination/antitermination protein NusA [bacterium]|nr:transcription termination/antitermination protein NusA [candidate division CSSED10-310 bacterium]
MLQIIDQLGRDRGIDREVLIEAIEASVVHAARKHLGSSETLEAHLNRETGKIELYTLKTVVETVGTPEREIALDKAKEIFADVEPGEEIEIRRDFAELGRIAAQSAKQVIMQRVRDAERDIVFEHYHNRVNELVNGIVMRIERGNVYVDLGKGEAILPRNEQSPRDHFHRGDRIRALLIEVRKDKPGPQLWLSRSNPLLIKKLFENEVPEIYDGIVEIKECVREPGGRSKICVVSHDYNVDPVGACVGVKGARVQSVVRELRGENIDIIPWTEEPVIFISQALSPAQVSRVELNPKTGSAIVVVNDDMLSLAIGKKGQNVRLAAKLTGWRLEIQSETEMARAREIMRGKIEEAVLKFHRLDGVSESIARLLTEQYLNFSALAEGSLRWIAGLPEQNDESAARIVAQALVLAREEEGYGNDNNPEDDETVTGDVFPDDDEDDNANGEDDATV